MIIYGIMMQMINNRYRGCVSLDFDYAIKFASLIITFFVLTSGYLIPYQNGKVWLRWIFWINSMGLGFSVLMMNEFKHLILTCTSESLARVQCSQCSSATNLVQMPSGPEYGNLANQVCTLPGGISGSAQIRGSEYAKLAFSYDPKDLWRNYGFMILLVFGFLFLNTTLGEVLRYGAGGTTFTYFARENAERKKLNHGLMRKREKRHLKQGSQGSDLNITSKAVLTWESLCYDVPVSSGQLRLLKDVFGYVRPGVLTALMSASGAGKTTLLDVLAARKNVGVISGNVLVDGIAPGTAFQRGTSYAEQLDVHESTQTVREALRFSANLRQPYETSLSEKYSYVEEIISLLEMEDIADAIIGDPAIGLAVEQRKRVTIGVELAAKPELLLFLDGKEDWWVPEQTGAYIYLEPTSGLDSQSAFNIVRFLKKLAAAGQCILCTIQSVQTVRPKRGPC